MEQFKLWNVRKGAIPFGGEKRERRVNVHVTVIGEGGGRIKKEKEMSKNRILRNKDHYSYYYWKLFSFEWRDFELY